MWIRESAEHFELRAGREGDDAYVQVDRSNPQYEQLLAVLSAARHAAES